MPMKIVVTPEMHDRMIELYEKNETIKAISNDIGVSYAFTYKYIREHTEVFGARKHIFPEIRSKMIEFWNDGHSAKEVADEFHVSLRTVYNVMKGNPVKFTARVSPQYDILRTNHDAIVKMWNDGLKTAYIANQYNVSTQYLYRYIVKNRESFQKRNGVLTSEMHDELVKLWNSGCKIKEIKAALGISSGKIYNHISFFPELFPKRPYGPKIQPENTKITPEVLEEIAKMWKQRVSVRDIAKHFDVSTQAIYKHISKHPEMFPEREKITPEEHAKLIELWKTDMSIREMAKAIERPVNTVTRYIDIHPNEFPKRKNFINVQTHDMIISLWNDGVKAKDIADMLGCSASNIFAFVTRNPNCTRRGKAGINRKLFVKLWNNGASADEIAKRIGIKKRSVYAYSKKFTECININTENEKKREAFVKLWNEGLPVVEIAEKLGIKTSTARYYSRTYPGCIPRN